MVPGETAAWLRRIALVTGCALGACLTAAAQETAAPGKAAPIPYPEWLFPIDPESRRPPPEKPPELDDVELLSVPDSAQKYTLARINDRFNPPDWHPDAHPPMPQIVAQGRKPKVMACAFCHSPTGQGRPENAALAGLPEAYIREQMLAFREGTRKPIGPDAYLPIRDMHALSATLTDEEIDAGAKYFAQQTLRRRVWVAESFSIPRAEPADWVYEEVGGSEELGQRLLEVAPDITRHQRRDDRMQYTAYVPPGALARGKRLATTGGGGRTQICATCHLDNLKGSDKIPPIAGRSPTYLLRQMLAYRNGDRGGEAALQMDPVVEKLELEDMIDLAAYLGSLYP